MENEIMTYEENGFENEVNETEARDHSGVISFAIGSLVTVGVIAGVKKMKKVIANYKAKKAAEAEETESY